MDTHARTTVPLHTHDSGTFLGSRHVQDRTYVDRLAIVKSFADKVSLVDEVCQAENRVRELLAQRRGSAQVCAPNEWVR